MNYTERDYQFKMGSPIEFAVMAFTSIFLSPYRLLNEISRKVIFLGRDRLRLLILTSIVLQAIIALISIAIGLFVSNKLYIVGTATSIVSIATGLLLQCIIYYVVTTSKHISLESCIDLSNLIDADLSQPPLRRVGNVKIAGLDIDEPVEEKKDCIASMLDEDDDSIDDMLQNPVTINMDKKEEQITIDMVKHEEPVSESELEAIKSFVNTDTTNESISLDSFTGGISNHSLEDLLNGVGDTSAYDNMVSEDNSLDDSALDLTMISGDSEFIGNMGA